MCGVDGCDRAVRRRKMCGMHYARVLRHGSPEPTKGCSGTPQERFERLGWNITESGCWEWKEFTNTDGYGMFRMASTSPMIGAHKASHVIYKGEVATGEVVRHTCDNPPCVNPDHLVLGTVADNVDDCVARKRRSPQRGNHNNARKISSEDAASIRETYARGGVSQQSLADEYGVTQAAISAVIRGKTWNAATQ